MNFTKIETKLHEKAIILTAVCPYCNHYNKIGVSGHKIGDEIMLIDKCKHWRQSYTDSFVFIENPKSKYEQYKI